MFNFSISTADVLALLGAGDICKHRYITLSVHNIET